VQLGGGGLYKKEVVVLRLTAKVLEDAVLPELLHVGPVFNLTVTNGHGHLVDLRVFIGLITDEEVQVGDVLAAATRGSTTSSGSRGGVLLGYTLGSDGRGNDVLRFSVAGVPHLGVASTIVNNDRGQARSTHLALFGGVDDTIRFWWFRTRAHPLFRCRTTTCPMACLVQSCAKLFNVDNNAPACLKSFAFFPILAGKSSGAFIHHICREHVGL
jgi:hypothetical protein